MNAKQLSLLDGRGLRDQALERVEAAAPPDWNDRALEAVFQAALRWSYFASDDVWRLGLEKPREPRAMGPVMMRAVKLGYCQPQDSTRISSIPGQHARPLRIYSSLIYGKSEAAIRVAARS